MSLEKLAIISFYQKMFLFAYIYIDNNSIAIFEKEVKIIRTYIVYMN